MINVFGSSVGQEELDEIKTSLDSQWLGLGKKVETFEKMMSEKTNLNGFTLIDNCSNGLYLALSMMNLPKNSEIIVPAVTWISCANAVLKAGLKPVFCDVDYHSINITNETLDEVVTENTKAIMLVHYAGLPCYIKTELPTIAECAHAVDTNVYGSHIANFYDINVFSFDSMKNIACGELGGIVSKRPFYNKIAKTLRYCGIEKSGLLASTNKSRWWEYECHIPFIKMLPNDISASIAIAQYKKLPRLQDVRKLIWDRYNEALCNIGWIEIPPEIPNHIKHSYFTYFIKVLNGKRDELAKYLLDNGIYTTVRYHPLHLMECFNSKQKLPVSELLNEQLLNLPLHPNLSDKDVEYIIDKIKDFK